MRLEPAVEKQFSLTDVYGADEAFVAMPAAGAVREVDRTIIVQSDRPVTARSRAYAAPVADDVAAAESADRLGRAR